MTFSLRLQRSPAVLLGAILGLSMLLGSALGQAAEQPQPAWRDPAVLKAALEIGLTPEQQPAFRDAITTFFQGYGADVRRLVNGRNVTNLPRKIARKLSNRTKEMNQTMSGFLSADQFARYENYRGILLAAMKQRRG